MLVTVAPTHAMSKSQKKTLTPEQYTSQKYVDTCLDVMDKDMTTLCYEYSSLVSMWMINEITANAITFEEAARRLASNFMLVDNAKNMRALGERLANRADEEKVMGSL